MRWLSLCVLMSDRVLRRVQSWKAYILLVIQELALENGSLLAAAAPSTIVSHRRRSLLAKCLVALPT